MWTLFLLVGPFCVGWLLLRDWYDDLMHPSYSRKWRDR